MNDNEYYWRIAKAAALLLGLVFVGAFGSCYQKTALIGTSEDPIAAACALKQENNMLHCLLSR